MARRRRKPRLKRTGPGTVQDIANNEFHLYLPDICKDAGFPANKHNLKMLADAASEVLPKEFGEDVKINFVD